MRKILMITILLISIFLVGCLDYKAYDLQPEDGSKDKGEIDLIDEIAAIEEELGISDRSPKVEEEVSEEIVLPELTEHEKEQNEITELEANMQTINVNENELLRLNVQVSDPDNDQVSYTYSAPLNTEGTWKTNYGDAGEYLVTLTATDGKLSTEKLVKIVVKRVNVPPIISGAKDMRVKEGATVVFKPAVIDPNNDPVTTTISEPISEGIWKTDHTSSGEYLVTVTATDGELEISETFVLTVDDVNVLPVIGGVSDLSVKEGEVVRIEPLVTDQDQDPISVTISEPVGDDGIWETSFTDNGVYNIQITASDGKDTVNKNIRLVVEDVNKPPIFVDVSHTTS
jgi:hypothetical protein